MIVKVPKRAIKAEHVFDELDTSLNNLNLQKADLLLLHWPCDVIVAGTLKPVWEAMEKCVADGKCRALGVCNFSVDALRQLLPLCTIPPAVNQVERHPLLPQMALVDFCINQDIVVQAHTPLGHGKLLSHETIVQVAEQTKLSPVQVLLQWNLMQGVANACKSSSEEHQKEIVEGSVVLSIDYVKKINAQRQSALYLHELGHALGLAHGTEKPDVMYYLVDTNNTLSNADMVETSSNCSVTNHCKNWRVR